MENAMAILTTQRSAILIMVIAKNLIRSTKVAMYNFLSSWAMVGALVVNMTLKLAAGMVVIVVEFWSASFLVKCLINRIL